MIESLPKDHLFAWEHFCRRRKDYLSALAEVVEESLLRRDTAHPVFCGCVDWHSSVHGCYALLVASRLAGQVRWADIALAVLNEEKLQEELLCLQRGELDHELPYGFAWFLKLTKELEQKHGIHVLGNLSSTIADRLAIWLLSLSPEEIAGGLKNRKYGNLSWPILNLWEWSQLKGDGKLAKDLKHFSEEYLLPSKGVKGLRCDTDEDEFFSASLQRIRAILAVFPDSHGLAWFSMSEKEITDLQPLAHAPFPHSGGLNFSRSWGLWDLFVATQKHVFRDMYVDHIVTHMELPQFWRDDYRKFGHWVPQFGIYALGLSMDASEMASP